MGRLRTNGTQHKTDDCWNVTCTQPKHIKLGDGEQTPHNVLNDNSCYSEMLMLHIIIGPRYCDAIFFACQYLEARVHKTNNSGDIMKNSSVLHSSIIKCSLDYSPS